MYPCAIKYLNFVCISRSVMCDSATQWTVAHQAPLSKGFSRQEYWSKLPFSSPKLILELRDSLVKTGNLYNLVIVWHPKRLIRKLSF